MKKFIILLFSLFGILLAGCGNMEIEELLKKNQEAMSKEKGFKVKAVIEGNSLVDGQQVNIKSKMDMEVTQDQKARFQMNFENTPIPGGIPTIEGYYEKGVIYQKINNVWIKMDVNSGMDNNPDQLNQQLINIIKVAQKENKDAVKLEEQGDQYMISLDLSSEKASQELKKMIEEMYKQRSSAQTAQFGTLQPQPQDLGNVVFNRYRAEMKIDKETYQTKSLLMDIMVSQTENNKTVTSSMKITYDFEGVLTTDITIPESVKQEAKTLQEYFNDVLGGLVQPQIQLPDQYQQQNPNQDDSL